SRPLHARPLPEEEFVAPRNDIERTLVAIWQEALGIDRVGIHDNFFALGGDSIHSLQIMARARQTALQFTHKQMFERKTIAELATVISTARAVAVEQGAVAGEVLLTPIQRHFFAPRSPDIHEFSQMALLEARRPLQVTLLRRALAHLFAHHDALRS